MRVSSKPNARCDADARTGPSPTKLLFKALQNPYQTLTNQILNSSLPNPDQKPTKSLSNLYQPHFYGILTKSLHNPHQILT